jgi:hypothetical protein
VVTSVAVVVGVAIWRVSTVGAHGGNHAPDREKGGGDVVRLVHEALRQRGVDEVRLRARKSGEVDKARVRIDRDKCASDPPLYPLDCEVKVD